jgi:hypothetical protein
MRGYKLLSETGQEDIELPRVLGGEMPCERYYGANATNRQALGAVGSPKARKAE